MTYKPWAQRSEAERRVSREGFQRLQDSKRRKRAKHERISAGQCLQIIRDQAGTYRHCKHSTRGVQGRCWQHGGESRREERA